MTPNQQLRQALVPVWTWVDPVLAWAAQAFRWLRNGMAAAGVPSWAGTAVLAALAALAAWATLRVLRPWSRVLLLVVLGLLAAHAFDLV